MLGYLILIFVTVPIIELALLIRVGQFIGVFNTLSLVILTAMLGAFLARREGARTLIGIRRDLEMGILPSERLLDGLFIFSGGLLLLTPGFFTDLVGFLLLVPFTRNYAKELMRRKFRAMIEKNEVTFF